MKKPAFSQSDRLWLVLLASRVRNWKESLLIFKPGTLLGWHRQGFRLFWKFNSRNRGGRPILTIETITLIQQMAQEDRLWGDEWIRGELLKLGLVVATHTIQKYIIQVRLSKPASQTGTIFLKNHAKDIWACGFLPVIDLWFRPLYLFFIIELLANACELCGSPIAVEVHYIHQLDDLKQKTKNDKAKPAWAKFMIARH